MNETNFFKQIQNKDELEEAKKEAQENIVMGQEGKKTYKEIKEERRQAQEAEVEAKKKTAEDARIAEIERKKREKAIRAEKETADMKDYLKKYGGEGNIARDIKKAKESSGEISRKITEELERREAQKELAKRQFAEGGKSSEGALFAEKHAGRFKDVKEEEKVKEAARRLERGEGVGERFVEFGKRKPVSFEEWEKMSPKEQEGKLEAMRNRARKQRENKQRKQEEIQIKQEEAQRKEAARKEKFQKQGDVYKESLEPGKMTAEEKEEFWRKKKIQQEQKEQETIQREIEADKKMRESFIGGEKVKEAEEKAEAEKERLKSALKEHMTTEYEEKPAEEEKAA